MTKQINLSEETIKEVIRTFKGSISRLEKYGIGNPDERSRFHQAGSLTIDSGDVDGETLKEWRQEYEKQKLRIKEKEEVLAIFEELFDAIDKRCDECKRITGDVGKNGVCEECYQMFLNSK